MTHLSPLRTTLKSLSSHPLSPKHRHCNQTSLLEVSALPLTSHVMFGSHFLSLSLQVGLSLLLDARFHMDRDSMVMSLKSMPAVGIVGITHIPRTGAALRNLYLPRSSSQVHIGQLYSTDKLIIENQEKPRT
ncbi:LYR motif-containing protein 4 isoform X2 [Panthera leo]|uniref:LYR motif-containing protein 4 isoform X2 n=1 Tax=Panthera leo TaxID=9689 RepID=UPI001C69DD0C|nr:LYR motif-containing protein 4 isoform X2 [Panthera leo]